MFKNGLSLCIELARLFVNNRAYSIEEIQECIGVTETELTACLQAHPDWFDQKDNLWWLSEEGTNFLQSFAESIVAEHRIQAVPRVYTDYEIEDERDRRVAETLRIYVKEREARGDTVSHAERFETTPQGLRGLRVAHQAITRELHTEINRLRDMLTQYRKKYGKI